jgi:hypothetical protein
MTLGWYGIAVGTLLLLKLLLSIRRTGAVAQPRRAYTPDLSVAAIITVYNEAPRHVSRIGLSWLTTAQKLTMRIVCLANCSRHSLPPGCSST